MYVGRCALDTHTCTCVSRGQRRTSLCIFLSFHVLELFLSNSLAELGAHHFLSRLAVKQDSAMIICLLSPLLLPRPALRLQVDVAALTFHVEPADPHSSVGSALPLGVISPAIVFYSF